MSSARELGRGGFGGGSAPEQATPFRVLLKLVRFGPGWFAGTVLFDFVTFVVVPYRSASRRARSSTRSPGSRRL